MAGLSLEHVKYKIIEPALTVIGLMSSTALNLGAGTGKAESDYVYLEQVDAAGRATGPALGFWQMEPATEQDIWTNFLAYQHDLAQRVKSLLWPGSTTPQLLGNLPYAAAMCRIKYLRAPDELPGAKDAAALAAYHKKIYNSAHGAADAAKNTPLFQQAIDA